MKQATEPGLMVSTQRCVLMGHHSALGVFVGQQRKLEQDKELLSTVENVPPWEHHAQAGCCPDSGFAPRSQGGPLSQREQVSLQCGDAPLPVVTRGVE